MTNTKERHTRGIFIGVIILFVLACNMPGGQPLAPSSAQVPEKISATQPSSTREATSSKMPTPTLLPGMKSSGSSGASQTPIPILPDFDPILDFGGGGGGVCVEYPTTPNSMSVDASFDDGAALCVYLQKANVAAPIKINLTQLGGTGMELSSNDLILNWIHKRVYWEGFGDAGEIYKWADDGSIQFEIQIWWPITLHDGNWRFTVHQVGGMQASADFRVAKSSSQSYINAVDSQTGRELSPSSATKDMQRLQVMDNGKVTFLGSNYPPEIPVYILLYKDNKKGEYELIEKKAILSDSSGSINGELSGPFGAGQSYILYGITDPKAVLGGADVAVTCSQALGPGFGLSCDYFSIVSKPAPSEIGAKYTALGGATGVLGRPAGDEQETIDVKGRFRDYQIGSIYWTSGTGAFGVQGIIRDKWVRLGEYRGFLGFPTTDELITPDGVGRYNHFQGGSIYWTPKTGAFEVHGPIRDKWAQLGWEKSILGYPTADEATTPDGIGRYHSFQGGSIYWTPNKGAFEIHGSIREKWGQLGWENSCLGYPVSDEEPSSGGWERQSRFEHGIIKWSSSKGALPTCNGN